MGGAESLFEGITGENFQNMEIDLDIQLHVNKSPYYLHVKRPSPRHYNEMIKKKERTLKEPEGKKSGDLQKNS